MLYFGNPSSRRVRDAMHAGLIDFIATPRQGNALIDGVPWCADNGCFSDKYVGDQAWFAWLTSKATHAGSCRFAVAPDVVGDAAATLARSMPWLPRIRALGYPAAFVAQNGLTVESCPWDAFDVLFIGGYDDFKLGLVARELAHEAKGRGKWVHMGRVNSRKRWRYAAEIGCDSVDGTTLARYADATLPDVLSWVREDRDQTRLFGAFA